MRSILRSGAVVSALSLAVVGALTALPAGATSGRDAVFCSNVKKLATVPVLVLPTSTSYVDLLNTLTTLSDDQIALTKDLKTIREMSSAVPSVTAKAWYAKAATAVVAENADLNTVLNDATTLLTNPKNNNAIVTVANAVASAASNAAVTNTYLTVAKPVSSGLCAKWPTPAKPKPKPKKKG